MQFNALKYVCGNVSSFKNNTIKRRCDIYQNKKKIIVFTSTQFPQIVPLTMWIMGSQNLQFRKLVIDPTWQMLNTSWHPKETFIKGELLFDTLLLIFSVQLFSKPTVKHKVYTRKKEKKIKDIASYQTDHHFFFLSYIFFYVTVVEKV